jgi:hypothetical protein
MLTEQQRLRYETTRQMAKEEMDLLDKDIMAELAKAKATLKELQEAKKAVKQIYDGACARLGVKSVIELKDYTIADLEKQA